MGFLGRCPVEIISATTRIESLFRFFVSKSDPMTNEEGKEVFRGRLEARAAPIMVG